MARGSSKRGFVSPIGVRQWSIQCSVVPSLQYAESRVEAGPEVTVVQGTGGEDFRANSRSHRLIERSATVWEFRFFVFISVSSGCYSQERNKWIFEF